MLTRVSFSWFDSVLYGVSPVKKNVSLQGTGRQMKGAGIYLFTHWCIGPFLLWLFPFHLRLGVQGVWAALAVISNVQVFFMSAAVWCIDWDEEARRAAGLVRSESYRQPWSARSRDLNDFQDPLLPECGSDALL